MPPYLVALCISYLFLYFIISCLLLYKFRLTRQPRFFLYVLLRPVVLTFRSCPNPLFENKAKCEAFDIKLIVILMQMKLIRRPRKWPLNQLFYYDNRPANAADFVWIYCKRKKIPFPRFFWRLYGFLLCVSCMCWNPCRLNIHHVVIFWCV